MATTLTSEYQDIASNAFEYNYGGYSYRWSITIQARYRAGSISGDSSTIRVRALIRNEWGYGWYGTNKGYNILNRGEVSYSDTVEGYSSFYTQEYDITNVAGGTTTNVYGSWRVMTYSTSASGNVIMPHFNSAPTGLTCSNIIRGAESFSALVTVSGWGVGGTTAGRYRELQVWTYSSSGLVEPRRFQTEYGSTLSSVITVNNNSSTSSTPLIITPNTKYVIGTYATNGAVATGSQRYGAYTTICQSPTISKNSEIRTSYNKSIVTFNYQTPADGGEYNKTLEYSLDGNSWSSTGVVISTGSQSTGTFNLTLDAGTSYIIYLRSTTDAGNSEPGTIQITTLPKSDITYTIDYKDINPVSVAITGNDHLFIYGQSILQFTIDNIRSEYNTDIGTISLSINNRNFTGTTTFTTDAQGITTNDSPVIINYGTVDFEGTKTATISISDAQGHDIYTKTVDISVLQRAKIGTVTYSFNDKPFYLTSTMTVDSWFGASSKALVKCRLYWTGDGGQTYDYTISDILNVQPWITISPNKWTATTSAEVPQVTQYTQFTVTLDLTEATGDYSGNAPWQWIIDKAKSGEFDNFNFEWSIETENGVDTKSITNLTTLQNYEFKLVEGVVVNDVLTQVVRDIDFDFVRFLNNSQLQRNKDIRRLILIKNS